jgi:hypothetical protein
MLAVKLCRNQLIRAKQLWSSDGCIRRFAEPQPYYDITAALKLSEMSEMSEMSQYVPAYPSVVLIGSKIWSPLL